MSTDDVPEFTCAAVRERPLVVKSKKEIVERVCGESSGCRPDMHRRTKVDMCDILRDRIGNFSRGFQNARSHNGRFLRHRFFSKPTNVAAQNSLPKRIDVAKEAVSAASQTQRRYRSDQYRKPNDALMTKPRPCVKTMLYARRTTCEPEIHSECRQASNEERPDRIASTGWARPKIGCVPNWGRAHQGFAR